MLSRRARREGAILLPSTGKHFPFFEMLSRRADGSTGEHFLTGATGEHFQNVLTSSWPVARAPRGNIFWEGGLRPSAATGKHYLCCPVGRIGPTGKHSGKSRKAHYVPPSSRRGRRGNIFATRATGKHSQKCSPVAAVRKMLLRRTYAATGEHSRMLPRRRRGGCHASGLTRPTGKHSRMLSRRRRGGCAGSGKTLPLQSMNYVKH